MMKTAILYCCLLTGGQLFSQTALIAHKSHSGKASTFSFADPGNFGIPPSRLEKVTWVNDSTVILKKDKWGSFQTDTVYNHPVFSDPTVTVDSFKKYYKWENTQFENFEQREPAVVPAKAEPAIGKPVDVTPVEAVPLKTTQPKRKKQHQLFLLWLIGGGMFGGMLLIFRQPKANSIAIQSAHSSKTV